MSTTTPTKTIQTELLAITNISASAQQISSVLDVSGKFGVTIYVDISPEATNTPGTEIRIESSQKSSGNDAWVPITGVVTTTATVNSNAVDGTEAAGSTVIEETTTTGLALGQWIFFKNGTIGNSEWAKLVALTASTSFTIQDGLTNAQTSSTWYNRGERFAFTLDCSSYYRLRVVINNNYGSSAVAVNARVAATTLDSLGTV